MQYETRTLKIVVLPKGEPIFSQQATTIEIDDEAAGEFVKVSQYGSDAGDPEIIIAPEDWPTISDAITDMISKCRPIISEKHNTPKQ